MRCNVLVFVDRIVFVVDDVLRNAVLRQKSRILIWQAYR